MTDTCITPPPDIHSSPTLSMWRIVPYDRTLLFIFEDSIRSEDDAISTIVSNFNPNSVITGRRLAVEEKTSMVLEVLFATKELQSQAIRPGLRYSNATFMSCTASASLANYTVITLSQMALISEGGLPASFQHWINVILTDANATKVSPSDIRQIWFETDTVGAYRGVGTVVLCGYDSQLMDAKNMRRYINAPNYPTPQCCIRYSYLYCVHCRILDDHKTVDCVYIEQHSNTLTPKEMVIPVDVDKEGEDGGSLRRPGKRIR